MIVGLSVGTTLGLTASLVHVFNHALMKGALFLALAGVMLRVGSVHLSRFPGWGKHMPFTMAGLVVAGWGLVGVPLTAGFISKWYLVLAVIEKGWWYVALLILLGSLLAIVYLWKVVEAAYFKTSAADAEPVKEAPALILIPMWILVLANLYFGVDTRLSVDVAQAAANSLFGIAP